MYIELRSCALRYGSYEFHIDHCHVKVHGYIGTVACRAPWRSVGLDSREHHATTRREQEEPQ